MTESTQMHKALDHQTGAVKYLTTGKKNKKLLCYSQTQDVKRKHNIFFFVTRLGLQYIGESDMTLDVGQMTLFKKAGFTLHSTANPGSGICTLLCRYLILI